MTAVMTGNRPLAAFALIAGAIILDAPARAEFREIETSIPFVSHGGIRDWRAIDRDTLYVQDAHRQWHRAELLGSCIDLPFAEAIGFEAWGTDRFDKFSSVIVRGQRCALKSLVASGPPLPRKQKPITRG